MTHIWQHKISPLFAALVGSYLFVWGGASFGISLLVALGIDFHAAEAGIFILAFPLMLSLFLWSFIRNHIAVWLLLFAGGAALTLAAWWLQTSLVI